MAEHLITMERYFEKLKEKHSQLMRVQPSDGQEIDKKALISKIRTYQNQRVEVHLASFRNSNVNVSDWSNNSNNNNKSK